MLRNANGRLTTVFLLVSIGANIYLMFSYRHPVDLKHLRRKSSIASDKGLSLLEMQNAKFLNLNLEQLGDNTHENIDEQQIADNSFCSVQSNWADELHNPIIHTDLTQWRFNTRVECPEFILKKYPIKREKISLNCDISAPTMVKSFANSTQDVEQVEFGDTCLEDVIDNCCTDKQQVPNVVHYIWYAKNELGYFQFISFLSALRFIKPCLILIHGNDLPYGKYWDYFISISPNIIHVKRNRPEQIFGHKLAYMEHASDIMRIEALKMYGGIYLDFDEIVLRPLEPLRKYEYTQGHELRNTLGSQLVMAKKDADFLNHWYLSYKTDYSRTWAKNALWIPYTLAKKYPELIHVEGYNFTRPNWKNAKQIFNQNYNWSTNYAMHLFARWYKNETDVDIIRTLNTTIGAVCRHVMFGNKELCSKQVA